MPSEVSQEVLDDVGLRLMDLHGAKREEITYHQKATLASTPIVHAGLSALIDEYRLSALSPETLLTTDRRARLLTALVTWTPSDYDEILRPGGSVWRVQSSTDGPGHVFWTLQLRQIG